MANVKISDLTAYTDPVATDVLPIVDLVNDQTKKVKVEDLLKKFGTGTEALPSFAFTGDLDTGIYSPGANQFAVSTGGTQRLLIDASGNTTLQGNLTVIGTSTTIESTTLTVDDKNIELGTVSTPSDTTADGGGITLKGATDKTINWVQSTGCWTFNQPTNFNNHVRIDSSGNVGVNTTNPQSKIHVFSGQSSSAVTPVITLDWNSSTARNNFIGLNDADELVLSADESNLGTDSAVLFRVDAAERVRIDSSGRLLVGTTSSITANSYAKVSVVDSVGAEISLGRNDSSVTEANSLGAIRFYGNDGGSYQECAHIIARADGTHANDDKPTRLVFSTTPSGSSTSSERMRIDSSGNIGIGTTTIDGTFDTNLNVHGASNSRLKLSNNTSGTGNTDGFDITTSGINCFLINREAGFMAFQTSNTERARIDSAGTFRVRGAGSVAGVNDAVEIDGSAPSNSLRVDASGRLLVGTSASPTSGSGNIAKSVIQGNTSSTTGAGYLSLQRGQLSASISSGGTLGLINFADSAGNDYAIIKGRTGAAGGSNDYPGELVFSTTADGASSTTERMVIDSSGKVGIGTTSPTFTTGGGVHNKGSNDAFTSFRASVNANTGIDFAAGSDGKGYVYNRDNADLIIGTNNTERMRILSSGNVGIGTNSPASKLHIQNTSSNDGLRIISSTSGEGFVIFGDTLDSNTGAVVYNHSSDSLRFEVNNSTAVTINSSQNVGIGTSSPASKAHVKGGSLTVEHNSPSTGTGQFNINSESNSQVSLSYDDQGHISIGTASAPTGQTGFSEKVRIDSSGRVLIGTSSVVSSEWDPNLQVVGDNTPCSFVLARNDTTVGADSTLAAIRIFGNDSNGTYQECARIAGVSDGDHGTGDKPTRLAFFTTADGASSPTERMRIHSDGLIDMNISSNAALTEPLRIRNGGSGAGTNVGMVFYNGDGSSTGAGALARITAVDANNYDSNLVFEVANKSGFSNATTEAMRIDSSGRLNIGATSNAYTNARLHVNNPEGSFFVTTNSHLLLQNKNSSTTNWWNIAPRNNGNLTIGNGAPNYLGVITDEKIVINSSGDVTVTGTVSDSIGPLRRLGNTAKSSSAAFSASDAGKLVRISGSATLTINTGVFTQGDMVSVFNATTADRTIAQGSGVTLYNTADNTTGNRTLASHGICTFVCTGTSNEFAITGSGLS